MPRELYDHYFRQAKRDGYQSRAAYKLMQIDDRRRIMRHGDRVLDLGCAPGSWLQVAAERVGRRGRVVGLDQRPLECPLPEHVRVLCGDVYAIEPRDLLAAAGGGRLFDLILSDMAPNTSGSREIDHHQSLRLCQRALELCAALLRQGGRLVMKVFEGEAYPDLLKQCRVSFAKVKGFKPMASRDISTEMYVIAEGYRGPEAAEALAADDEPAEVRIVLPKGRPSTGWSRREA